MARNKFDMNAARNYSIVKEEQARKLEQARAKVERDPSVIIYYKGTWDRVLPKSLEDKFDAIERQNWLDEKYTHGEDFIHLHKSDRKFSTNTPLSPVEAYSIKQETGLSYKQLDYIFNN